MSTHFENQFAEILIRQDMGRPLIMKELTSDGGRIQGEG